MKLARPAVDRTGFDRRLAGVFLAQGRLFKRKRNDTSINGRHLDRMPSLTVPPLVDPHK